MPVRLRCQCGQSLTLPEQKAGLRVQCPVCSEYLTIPAAPPAGPTEFVAAATTKVQAELVAAISGDGKSKTSGAKSGKKLASAGTSKQQGAKSQAKERPLASPPKTAPVIAPARPEPRIAKPREAPQPPPRKSRALAPEGTPSSASPNDAVQNPPPRPVAAKPAIAPPPLPTAKVIPPAPATTPPPVAAPVSPPQVALFEKVAAPVIDIKPDKASQATKSPAPAVGAPAAVAPPVAASETPTVRGVEHDPAKRLTVYQLGCGLLALALASSYPAAMEIVRHVRDPLSPGIENWAYFVLLVGGVQLVYALYLVQLPDWSSVWVTMVVTAIVAVLYAVGMGMSLVAPPDNEVIAALGLTQLHAGGYLSLWCFMLTLLTALLSYSMVRTSVKWHRMFELAMTHAEE